MTTETIKVIGTLAAMHTVIEKFPMDFLHKIKSKRYNNLFELIIDILLLCNVDVNEIISKVLNWVYGVTIDKIDLKIESVYDAIGNLNYSPDDNAWVNALEVSLKTTIQSLLVSLTSCSSIPVLPNEAFDKPNPIVFKAIGNSSSFELLTNDAYEKIIIPKRLIDPMGILDISPTSKIGTCYYNVGQDVYYVKTPIDDDKYEYKRCLYSSDIKFKRVGFEDINSCDSNSPDFVVVREGENPNMLYKTNDMNAFLWYCLHRGMKTPQIEYNHMMWDSRRQSKQRQTPEEWNKWYESKKNPNDEFKIDGKYIDKNSDLYPILQISPQGLNEGYLRIEIPCQTYWKPSVRNAFIESQNNSENNTKRINNFNKDIYTFNWQYLQSIQILQPKILLARFFSYLLNISGDYLTSIKYSVTHKLIEAKISNAIKNIIEADDMAVEDCYMQFSNEEFDIMLEEMLSGKYSDKNNISGILNTLDSISPNASMAGDSAVISKLITDVIANPTIEASYQWNQEFSHDDASILPKFLWAIMMSFAMSIFTPQLLLLIYINLHLMGLTRIDSFSGIDFNTILNYILNRVFSLIKGCIIHLKNKIIEPLCSWAYEKIRNMLSTYSLYIMYEYMESWLNILTRALSILYGAYNLINNKVNVISPIENVNYADIISNNQDIPESTAMC